MAFQPGRRISIRGGDLQPWRPHQFRVKEFPDVVISFTVEGGKVTAMRQRDPSGEFVFPRVPGATIAQAPGNQPTGVFP